MKRIFLICCLFLSACAAAVAQSTIPPHPIPTPVSKPDFIVKVGELNTFITAGNLTAANAKWTEISQLMNNEMIVVRYKYQDAEDAHNEADKAHYQDLSRSQRTLYGQVLQLKNDMPTNKTAINDKLSTFAASII